MTPEREAYLSKCSNREIWLRSEIRNIEIDIHWQKYRLSNANEEWIATGAKCALWYKNQALMTLRHELQRLKGMDRVVVPRRAILARWSGIWLGYCKCGSSVKSLETYCPNCGRRILWGEVLKRGERK